MSCKSALYAANASSQALTVPSVAGTVVPLGTTIRRFGCNAKLSGTGVLIEGEGYYDIETNVVFTPTAAGIFTVALLKDGAAIPGAAQTLTAAAGSTYSVNVPAIVRNQCCNGASTITVVISADAVPAAVTVNNAAIVVEKI